MPSPITISIRVQPYLVDFMVSIYGPQPIEFPRKDNFNRILNVFLDKEPESKSHYNPTETNLDILLPYFEDKNVLYNFHLSSVQKRILVRKIEDKFRLSFRDEVDQYLLLGFTRIEAIYFFMEKYNIREESIEMLKKDYHRFRNSKACKNYRKKLKNSSVKARFCPPRHTAS